jgi:predicted lipase
MRLLSLMRKELQVHGTYKVEDVHDLHPLLFSRHFRGTKIKGLHIHDVWRIVDVTRATTFW